jgi:peroxiredoxin
VLKRENPTIRRILQLLIGILIGAAVTLLLLEGFPGNSESRIQTIPTPPSKTASPQEAEGVVTAPIVGSIAPNFQLHDIEDHQHELIDYRGNIVLLNFWATWCAPCRLEMPLLEQHSRMLAGQGVVILAVNLRESLGSVGEFIEEMDLTMPVLLDSEGKVSELYRIIGYPSTIIIDASGRIKVIHIGIISEEQLDEYLEQVGIYS